MKFSIPTNAISAADSKMGIGKDGQLPWRLKKEMQYFNRLTTYTSDPSKMNAVVMGRKTWDSIPAKFRPLSKRFNIVLSASKSAETAQDSLVWCKSWQEISDVILNNESHLETCWIIGGYALYNHAVQSGLADRIFLTRIHKNFDCDVTFPDLSASRYERLDCRQVIQLNKSEKMLAEIDFDVQTEDGVEYEYQVWHLRS